MEISSSFQPTGRSGKISTVRRKPTLSDTLANYNHAKGLRKHWSDAPPPTEEDHHMATFLALTYVCHHLADHKGDDYKDAQDYYRDEPTWDQRFCRNPLECARKYATGDPDYSGAHVTSSSGVTFELEAKVGSHPEPKSPGPLQVQLR